MERSAVRAETGEALVTALEKDGVEFIPENGGASARAQRSEEEKQGGNPPDSANNV